MSIVDGLSSGELADDDSKFMAGECFEGQEGTPPLTGEESRTNAMEFAHGICPASRSLLALALRISLRSSSPLFSFFHWLCPRASTKSESQHLSHTPTMA